MKQVRVCEVLIASPNDVILERDAICQAIDNWNSVNWESTGVVLRPVRWELDSVPNMGDRPQGILNRQLVDKCHILIGVFWTRLGSPTGVAPSGTVEEIERCIKLKKPVMLYFSDRAMPPSGIETPQLDSVRQYKSECEGKGLVTAFRSLDELKEKIQAHLTKTVTNLSSAGTSSSPPDPHAECLQFHRSRSEQIQSGNMPVALIDGPKLVFHSLPIGPSPAIEDFVSKARAHDLLLDPIARPPAPTHNVKYRPNADGFVTYWVPGGQGSAVSYVQLYRDGRIEAVDAYYLRSGSGLPTVDQRFEERLIRGVHCYLEAQKNLGVEPPLSLALSLTDIKGYYILLPIDEHDDEPDHRIDQELLTLPEFIVSEYAAEPTDVILKPALDVLWQAAGWDSCKHYYEGRYAWAR